MKYRLLTPSGVETPDEWNDIESIPARAADRFERSFETEEAELIQIDDKGNRVNLGFLINNRPDTTKRLFGG